MAAFSRLQEPSSDIPQQRVDRMAGGKLSIAREIWCFMRVRKKWWLGPILFVLLLLGMLLVATQGSVLAPFIYTIF